MRSKKIDDHWYPQRRFMFLWFIPTFWTNITYNYGDDDLLGLQSTPCKFDSKIESDSFINCLNGWKNETNK